MLKTYSIQVLRDGRKPVLRTVKAHSLKEAVNTASRRYAQSEEWHTVEAALNGGSGRFSCAENKVEFVIERN